MSAIELHSERLSEDCLKVLGSYAVREAAIKTGSAEHSGWLDRIDQIPGMDPRELTMVHGFLIAQGMLKFEITGRSAGLQYQVSTIGRDTLQRQPADPAEQSAAEESVREMSGSPGATEASLMPQRGAA